MPTPTSIPRVAEALEQLSAMQAQLSAEVTAEIMKRMSTFTAETVLPARSNQTSLSQSLLVTRPGKPPRPLDPFFFELVTLEYD